MPTQIIAIFYITAVRYNSCVIKFTPFKCPIQWLLIFKVVQPSPVILEHFYHPKGKPYTLSSYSQFTTLPPQPLESSNLLPASMTFSILRITYKYSHTTYGLL